MLVLTLLSNFWDFLTFQAIIIWTGRQNEFLQYNFSALSVSIDGRIGGQELDIEFIDSVDFCGCSSQNLVLNPEYCGINVNYEVFDGIEASRTPV